MTPALELYDAGSRPGHDLAGSRHLGDLTTRPRPGNDPAAGIYAVRVETQRRFER
jgi:hypothetical protein